MSFQDDMRSDDPLRKAEMLADVADQISKSLPKEDITKSDYKKDVAQVKHDRNVESLKEEGKGSGWVPTSQSNSSPAISKNTDGNPHIRGAGYSHQNYQSSGALLQATKATAESAVQDSDASTGAYEMSKWTGMAGLDPKALFNSKNAAEKNLGDTLYHDGQKYSLGNVGSHFEVADAGGGSHWSLNEKDKGRYKVGNTTFKRNADDLKSLFGKDYITSAKESKGNAFKDFQHNNRIVNAKLEKMGVHGADNLTSKEIADALRKGRFGGKNYGVTMTPELRKVLLEKQALISHEVDMSQMGKNGLISLKSSIKNTATQGLQSSDAYKGSKFVIAGAKTGKLAIQGTTRVARAGISAGGNTVAGFRHLKNKVQTHNRLEAAQAKLQELKLTRPHDIEAINKQQNLILDIKNGYMDKKLHITESTQNVTSKLKHPIQNAKTKRAAKRADFYKKNPDAIRTKMHNANTKFKNFKGNIRNKLKTFRSKYTIGGRVDALKEKIKEGLRAIWRAIPFPIKAMVICLFLFLIIGPVSAAMVMTSASSVIPGGSTPSQNDENDTTMISDVFNGFAENGVEYKGFSEIIQNNYERYEKRMEAKIIREEHDHRAPESYDFRLGLHGPFYHYQYENNYEPKANKAPYACKYTHESNDSILQVRYPDLSDADLAKESSAFYEQMTKAIFSCATVATGDESGKSHIIFYYSYCKQLLEAMLKDPVIVRDTGDERIVYDASLHEVKRTTHSGPKRVTILFQYAGLMNTKAPCCINFAKGGAIEVDPATDEWMHRKGGGDKSDTYEVTNKNSKKYIKWDGWDEDNIDTARAFFENFDFEEAGIDATTMQMPSDGGGISAPQFNSDEIDQIIQWMRDNNDKLMNDPHAEERLKLIETGYKMVGKSVYGYSAGHSPIHSKAEAMNKTSYDCSGFISALLYAGGVDKSHDPRSCVGLLGSIPNEEVVNDNSFVPGDLLIKNRQAGTATGSANHVVMYLGPQLNPKDGKVYQFCTMECTTRKGHSGAMVNYYSSYGEFTGGRGGGYNLHVRPFANSYFHK